MKSSIWRDDEGSDTMVDGVNRSFYDGREGACAMAWRPGNFGKWPASTIGRHFSPGQRNEGADGRDACWPSC